MRNERVDILAVDDNPNNLATLEALFADLNANVIKAQSGDEALLRILERDFALALLDVQMPGIDGYETARLVRKRERSRHLPIIFLTAFSQEDQQVRYGYELGAVDFLFKPIVPEILVSKVSVFLDLHRQKAEVLRQAQLLQDASRREHERTMAEERARWEREALRAEMESERRAAEALGQKAEELARALHERERAEAALQEVAAELRLADRRKDEFLAMLAHELRNPLAPIVNALALVGRRNTDPGLARAVQSAERQAHHMARLIDDLLDVSRITEGKVELRREPTSLQLVVQQALETTAPMLESRNHTLLHRLPEQDVQIMVDGTRLSQVIANLLHNAAKYTDPGGHIELRCMVEGERLEIAVSDDGVGLEPAMLDRVFETFVQVEQSSDRARGGLGLGLTLVRTLVRMHGGEVFAESEGPGKGSTFRVRLPVVCPGAAEQPAALAADATVAPTRILVVEDNEDIRLTLRDLLELEGHEVFEAADGARGVEEILGRKPNVALVDIGLPCLDGYQVAQQVRATNPDGLRMVALTGYGGADVERKVFEAGFDAHLVKPVKLDELFRLIGQLS